MGVGTDVVPVVLDACRRGSNPDLPPPPSDDSLDLPGCRLPHLKPDDGVLGLLPDHVGGDEPDLPPCLLREGVHNPDPPDGGFNEGPGVPGHALVPDRPVGDSGELATPPGPEGDLPAAGRGDGESIHHVDERLPRVSS